MRPSSWSTTSRPISVCSTRCCSRIFAYASPSREIPVIFVTAMDAMESEQHGLELKAARDRLAGQNALLEARVAERTEELKLALEKTEVAHAALKKSYFGTLLAINALAELRGASIGEHSRRVAEQLALYRRHPARGADALAKIEAIAMTRR